jgi:predicted porin
MKQKLLVAALSLIVAGPALADSNVSLYGIADATVESVRATGATSPGTDLSWRQRVSSNSSLVGFLGAEDLGNGLQAIFQVESGVSLDVGGGTWASRDSFVGLRGGFGILKAGLLTSPMRGMGGKLNFIPGSTSIANNIGVFTTINGQQLGLNARMANSILYTTPNWGGFTAGFIYGANEGKTASKDDPSYGLGLTYDANSIFVGYAFEERKDKDLLAKTPSSDVEHRLALRYTFGGTRVGFGWDRHWSERAVWHRTGGRRQGFSRCARRAPFPGGRPE